MSRFGVNINETHGEKEQEIFRCKRREKLDWLASIESDDDDLQKLLWSNLWMR